MTIFVVRIELHAPHDTEDNYKRLHSAMQRTGFPRTSAEHHLPPAEYMSENVAHTNNKELFDRLCGRIRQQKVRGSITIQITPTDAPPFVQTTTL